jgi:hypothetical protein
MSTLRRCGCLWLQNGGYEGAGLTTKAQNMSRPHISMARAALEKEGPEITALHVEVGPAFFSASHLFDGDVW